MCGILAVVSRPNRFSRSEIRESLDTMVHRGPDGVGVEAYHVGPWEVWFGHRRLAIVDLSKTGEQPMSVTQAGAATHVVFNGEIYNHHDVRQTWLKNQPFRGSSDTEVLLRGLGAYGSDFVKELNAMLAFAYLDVSTKTMLIARDRLGKKPLYVYTTDDLMVVASELKAIVNLGIDLSINDQAMAYYKWLGYIPGPQTIYQEVQKFDSAMVGTIDLDLEQLVIERERYWDPLASFGERYTGSYENALDDLQDLLDDATRIRLDADVPVGAFLSGGIDSTLVVSAISRVRPDIRSFTVKLGDAALDESGLALETGAQLGVDVALLNIEPQPDDSLSWYYDEPFADISQIPTLAISEAARQHVTVVLTGDGGDELFLGYPWVEYPERIHAFRQLLPRIPALGLAHGLDTPLGHWAVAWAARALGMNPKTAAVKAKTVKELLSSRDTFSAYDLFKTQRHRELLPEAQQRLLAGSLSDFAQETHPDLDWDALATRSLPEFFGAVDLLLFLRDDVLVKVDRGTMAHSLEARAPLLDHRIVEFAHSLPLEFKIKDGQTKRILRDLLSRTVHGDVLKRGKQGFGVPVPNDIPQAESPSAAWAEQMLRDWRARWGRFDNIRL